MRALIIVLGLIVAACAIPRHSRIVCGEETTIEKYPFMAGMLTKFSDGTFHHDCGGTLVSSTSVVSAAHCFQIRAVSSWRVLLGTNNLISGGTEYIVSKIIIHPQFNSNTFFSDVAVIKLSNHAVFSDKVQIARIAGPRYPLPDNTLVNAIGWGALEYGGDFPDILQEVELNIINHQTCVQRYIDLDTIPDTIRYDTFDVTPEMLCTGILDVGGKDACNGDSGGPIIHNGDIIVGIISWSFECAHPTYPSVNVRVSSYSDWIYTNSLNNNTLIV